MGFYIKNVSRKVTHRSDGQPVILRWGKVQVILPPIGQMVEVPNELVAKRIATNYEGVEMVVSTAPLPPMVKPTTEVILQLGGAKRAGLSRKQVDEKETKDTTVAKTEVDVKKELHAKEEEAAAQEAADAMPEDDIEISDTGITLAVPKKRK